MVCFALLSVIYCLSCTNNIFAQQRVFSDNEIVEKLQNEDFSKFLPRLGNNEINVARHFETHKYPYPRGKSWDIIHSEAIVVGRVVKITDIEAYAGYGTEISIAVQKVLKGNIQNEIVTIKQVSGRRIRLTPENRSIYRNPKGNNLKITRTSDSRFQKDEIVLVSLSRIPQQLHFFTYYALTKNPASVDKPAIIEDWYKTYLTDYFEVGPIDKITIKRNDFIEDTLPLLPWYRSLKRLSDIAKEIDEITRD